MYVSVAAACACVCSRKRTPEQTCAQTTTCFNASHPQHHNSLFSRSFTHMISLHSLCWQVTLFAGVRSHMPVVMRGRGLSQITRLNHSISHSLTNHSLARSLTHSLTSGCVFQHDSDDERGGLEPEHVRIAPADTHLNNDHTLTNIHTCTLPLTHSHEV